MSSAILVCIFATGLMWTLRYDGALPLRVVTACVGGIIYLGLFRMMQALILRAERTAMPARLALWMGFLGLVVVNVAVWWGLKLAIS